MTRKILSNNTPILWLPFALANEDNICTTEGLECLLLLATIHMNEGALKKAWMTFRRALDAGRLLGINNCFASSTHNSESLDMSLRRRLWLSTIMGHCFCSLLLGLELEANNDSLSSDYAWDDQPFDNELDFQRRLCIVSVQLSQRNTRGLQHNPEETRKINMVLENLEHSMPENWWQKPEMSQERSVYCANEYDRLLCHLWFFQVQILVNVPFLFESSDEAHSSRDRCLEAARTTIYRYLGLRLSGNIQPHCRVTEIAIFLASLVLVLRSGRRTSSDIALVEQVIDSTSSLGKSSIREHVAKKSAEVLTLLLKRRTETDSLEDCLREDIFTPAALHPASDTLTTSWHEDLMASLRRTLEQYPESRVLDPIL
ncbi:hypothetical protein N7495_000767 [Penicillium taxi]|uniref:uncharacterized protein n=1 Tax=Penicillium taxi TaxID=168475 RepID=UPI002545A729|nr:uncharacterized protein N7495_000767 [Penicillium taxi]KAJ5908085.1 hypothetical protein N7495_000767 [Penicillium taxi]